MRMHAAWAVSLTSVCAVLGRLAVGLFVDRVNRRVVIACRRDPTSVHDAARE